LRNDQEEQLNTFKITSLLYPIVYKKANLILLRLSSQRILFLHMSGFLHIFTHVFLHTFYSIIIEMASTVYVENKYYHVFNRGVARQPIFKVKKDYLRAIKAIDFYRFLNPSLRLSKALLLAKEEKREFFKNLKKKEKIVNLICYCFMPNHFHFLLKQKRTNGVSKFISDFSNSYARYFNVRHERVGPLFQGVFKGVRIESEEQLSHVSRYIHINPITSSIIKETKINTYPWSSLPEYLGNIKKEICDKEAILTLFKNRKAYQKFVRNQAKIVKELKQIKHLTLE